MADISIIHNGSTDYNVKDAAGREALAVVENKGAKNILKTYDIPKTTSGNVVFSIIDGVCSVSTTATQTTARVLVYAMDTDVGNASVNSRYTIPRGTYILKTTGNGKVKLRAIEHDGTTTNQLAETTGADVEFTYSGTMPYVVFTLSVSSNTSLSEAVTFIPMCCLKSEYIIDQTAVKYGKTNAELTTLEQQDRDGLATAIDKGAKNLLKLGFTHKSSGSQTADMTADGNGIIVNGNRNTTTDTILVYDLVTNQSNMVDTRYTLPAGKYVIPSTGTSDLRYQVYCHDGTNYKSLGYTMTDQLEFEYTSALKAQYPYIAYRLWASRVSSFDNLTVYPMLCTKAEWDISNQYEPYALPNQVLTPALIEQVDGGAKNVLYYTKVGTSVESGSQYLSNGVRFTMQSDGSILVNRESSDANEAFCNLRLDSSTQFIDNFCNGQYVLSGSYGDCILRATNNTYNAIDSDGNGVVLQDKGAHTSIWVQLRVAASASPNNVTIKPMICTLADWNISHKYVPYKQDITWGLGDKIPQNSDFNSYTIPGVYRVENSTDAATMLHIPVTNGGGRLEVSIGDTSTEILHTYFSGNTEYRRSYNGTTWSDWTKVLSTSDLDATPTENSTNPVTSGGVKADQDRQDAVIQGLAEEVAALRNGAHYGFIIDKNNSDSYTAVSYTHDAVGFSPAYMDYTNSKFVYGSWENAWFIKDAVPVALNFDGTEAFELDKNDFTKKTDGTSSGINCITMELTDSQPSDWATNWKWYYTKSGDYYVAITDSSAPTWAENTYYKAVSALDVNFMLRMPKVYFKRTNDSSHNYIEISDRQLDSDFHAYAHIDANGTEKDYIYLPLFKGSMINGKLRSVPNVWPQNFTTAQQEINAATALGTGWQIWDHSSRELINDLLILISKSLDCQTSFGRGRELGFVDTPNQNYGLLKTGSLMQNGMFYGSSSSTAEVKVFGMEDLWANRWDRVLGLILLNNSWKIKMQPPYNLTADGYTTPSGASVPSGNGYFKSVHSSEYGSVPAVGGGEASKYYRDYFYKNASGTRVALVGGYCAVGAADGFRYVYVDAGASSSNWGVGASPVYK